MVRGRNIDFWVVLNPISPTRNKTPSSFHLNPRKIQNNDSDPFLCGEIGVRPLFVRCKISKRRHVPFSLYDSWLNVLVQVNIHLK